MYLSQSRYTGIRPLFTNPPPNSMRGSKKRGAIASAVGRFDTRQVEAMPIDTPQFEDNTQSAAKTINLVPSLSRPTKK
jgi:hypothetical protein